MKLPASGLCGFTLALLTACSSDDNSSKGSAAPPRIIAQTIINLSSENPELQLITTDESNSRMESVASLGCLYHGGEKFYKLSPNKQQVAYTYCDRNSGYQLRISHTDQSQPTIPVNDYIYSYTNFFYEWSPDNQWLLFSSDSVFKHYSLLNTTNLTQFQLTENASYSTEGMFSGDGKYFYYTAFNAATQKTEVWLFTSESTTQKKLFETPDSLELLGASQDGQFLAYNVNNGAQYSALLLYSRQTQAVTEIQRGFAVNFSWLKDSNTALYTDNASRVLTHLNAVTSRTEPLTDQTGNKIEADFYQVSPDQKRVVFSSVLLQSNHYGLAQLDEESLTLLAIVAHPLPAWGAEIASWSPDNKQVVIPIETDEPFRPTIQLFSRDGALNTVGKIPDGISNSVPVNRFVWSNSDQFSFLEGGSFSAEIFSGSLSGFSQTTTVFYRAFFFPSRESPIDLQADLHTSRLYYLRDKKGIDEFPNIESVNSNDPTDRLIIAAPDDGAFQYFDLL